MCIFVEETSRVHGLQKVDTNPSLVLFNELDVDGYFLEYDDERSGDFAPLRHVTKNKTVFLGLVTTKL